MTTHDATEPTNAAMDAAPRPVVVIAGGSGFIGRRLAALLGGSGFDVVILSRSAPRPSIGPVRFVHWQAEAAPEPAWTAELENARAVVNLCGESIGGPRWTDARKTLLVDSRVRPTEALVVACNAATRPPEAFVQVSGIGYYGTSNLALTEDSGSGNDFLADLARRWEAPLERLRDDVRPVIARLGVVLGRSGGALGQMLMPFRLFVGGPIADGRQWMSWIHLHDAAAAILKLIDNPASRGIYNLTAPEPVRNADFAKAVGRALGRPTWMFTPKVLLKMLLGEQATLVCDGQQVLPARLLAEHFEFSYPTLDAALAELI